MTDEKKQPVQFIGGRRYVSGVPARDMTEEEWDGIPLELRHKAINLGLYRLPKGYKLPISEDEPSHQEGSE